MASKDTRVIAVANRKGGVGKSTVAMLLASALASDGRRVLILDCDEQATVSNIATLEAATYDEAEPLVAVEDLAPRFVLDFLRAHGDKYDVILIDVPRITEDKTNTALAQLLALCDSVLIPVLGSHVDAISTREFLKLVEGIAEYKRDNGIPFSYFGFINRMNTRKDNEQAVAFLSSVGLPMFSATLNDLKVFTAPSVYFSILATAEGERRFRPFYDEFRIKFKIR